MRTAGAVMVKTVVGVLTVNPQRPSSVRDSSETLEFMLITKAPVSR
jgi:hypothetical protein